MKLYLIAVVALLWFGSSCKCPQVLAPVIHSNNDQPDSGGLLLLSVPTVEKENVVWTGPAGTYTGNALIVEHVTKEMSGEYSARYVRKCRKKCQSDAATKAIVVRGCPTWPTPVVTSSADHLVPGGNLILTVPDPGNNTVVMWQGPDSTHTGNTWNRMNATGKMAGVYKVQYSKRQLTGCLFVGATIELKERDRSIVAMYNGEKYYVEIVTSDHGAAIWLRQSQTSNDLAKDIQLAHAEVGQGNPETLKQQYNRYHGYVSKSLVWTGCAATAGAAACVFGTVVSGGVTVPACAVFVDVAGPAASLCLAGIAGELAKALGKERPFVIGTTGAAIAEGDLPEALQGLLDMVAILNDGGTPEVVGGKVTRAVLPAPGPTPAPGQQPGNSPAGQAQPKPQTGPHGGGHAGEAGPPGHAGGGGGGAKPGGGASPGGGHAGGNHNPGGNHGGGHQGGHHGEHHSGGNRGGGIGRLPFAETEPSEKEKKYLRDKLTQTIAHPDDYAGKGLIRDTAAAVGVAESILFQRLGQKEVETQQPYKILVEGQYWIISGKAAKPGKEAFLVILDRNDGRVLKVSP